MLNNLALGKAGELRVASELLLRGQEVYFAMVDSGTDLILANGKRIQVKVARKRKDEKFNRTAYFFSFKSWRKYEKKFTTHPLGEVDYVILWAIDDNMFLIIPANEIRGNYSVRFNPNSKSTNNLTSRYLQYIGRWNLLE